MADLALYWFCLAASPAQGAAWRAWLSPQERFRADRYLHREHGARYIAAHAQLRWLLGRELGCAPEAVAFRHDAQGKPHVEGSPLQFNLSHSGTLALIGMHPSVAVGVDIEAERPRNFPGLARRFFSPAEQAWLARHGGAAQSHAFCRLWTCKEAWMKADGRGLTVLRRPEVDLEASPPELLALERRWWFQELSLVPGYAAAAVMPAAPSAVSVTRLPPPPLR